MDTAVAMLQHSPDATREQLAHLKRSTSAMIEDIDTIIAALRPALLDDLGLLPALRAYAAERLDPLGVAWRFDVDGDEGTLPPQTEMALFRAVQEAISNVARLPGPPGSHHGLYKVGGVMVQVSDDGVGFEVSERPDPDASRPWGYWACRNGWRRSMGGADPIIPWSGHPTPHPRAERRSWRANMSRIRS
jgi:signal transduction histidine kinase